MVAAASASVGLNPAVTSSNDRVRQHGVGLGGCDAAVGPQRDADAGIREVLDVGDELRHQPLHGRWHGRARQNAGGERDDGAGAGDGVDDALVGVQAVGGHEADVFEGVEPGGERVEDALPPVDVRGGS